MTEPLLIVTDYGNIRLVHDLLVCRSFKGRLLRRLEARDIVNLFRTYCELQLRRMHKRRTPLPGDDIHIEVGRGSSGDSTAGYVNIIFAMDDGIAVLYDRQLDRINNRLRETIGADEYQDCVDGYIWNESSSCLVPAG